MANMLFWSSHVVARSHSIQFFGQVRSPPSGEEMYIPDSTAERVRAVEGTTNAAIAFGMTNVSDELFWKVECMLTKTSGYFLPRRHHCKSQATSSGLVVLRMLLTLM